MAHILNFSGGKDSTAMLLMILEKGLPLDYIINVDTTKEFPQMYEHIEQVKKYTGREIITLKVEFDFFFFFFKERFGKTEFRGQIGYGWPNLAFRWCTGLKREATRKIIKRLVSKGEPVTQYIGFAADETKRIERGKKNHPNFVYPLADFGMTEKDALQYCYSKGFTWGGLYEHFDRVSCFCCPLKNLRELKQMYLHYPEQWAQIKEMDKHSKKPFKNGHRAIELEERFRREIALEKRMLKLV